MGWETQEPRLREKRAVPAASAQVDFAPLGLNIVCDGLEQAVCRRAIEHAQHRGVRLGGKELEDGEHAACADVLTVQETQRIGCSIPRWAMDSRNWAKFTPWFARDPWQETVIAPIHLHPSRKKQ